MSNLLIVESPAKCAKIKSFLNKDWIVDASCGHIRDLNYKTLSINLEDMTPIYINNKDKGKIITKLQKLGKQCDVLWLAADNDREGEAIAWHIKELIKPKKYFRVIFNEITKSAVLNAINNPVELEMNIVNSQQTRRIIDRFIGYIYSPILWNTLGSSFKKHKTISIGRVQSMVNKLVIDKEEEIRLHQSSSYYTVNTELTLDKIDNIRAKLSTKLDTLSIVKKILKYGLKYNFIINDIVKSIKNEKPSPPFTTSTLQQEANKKLHIPTKIIMSIAQMLYEEGLITYMRTDSLALAEEVMEDIKTFINNEYGKEFYKKQIYQKKQAHAQEAHEACRPVDINVTPKKFKKLIKDNEKLQDPSVYKLYELIWNRTICSQMEPCVKDVTECILHINTNNDEINKFKFIALNEAIKFIGFKIIYNVYNIGNDSDESNEILVNNLIKLNKNDILQLNYFEGIEKYTKAPTRYTEASLIKKMEQLSIGRPSTYAAMINHIVIKEYNKIQDIKPTKMDTKNLIYSNNETIVKETFFELGGEKKKYVSTVLGQKINEFITNNFKDILNYDTVKNMESLLDEIALGKKDWQEELHKFYKILDDSTVNIVHNSKTKVLGNHPDNNNVLELYDSKYGLCIRETVGPKTYKYYNLPADAPKKITLEYVLPVLKYPRDIGKYKKLNIMLQKGRYGLYLKYNKKSYGIPNVDTIPESDITLDFAIDIIKKKDNK